MTGGIVIEETDVVAKKWKTTASKLHQWWGKTKVRPGRAYARGVESSSSSSSSSSVSDFLLLIIAPQCCSFDHRSVVVMMMMDDEGGSAWTQMCLHSIAKRSRGVIGIVVHR